MIRKIMAISANTKPTRYVSNTHNRADKSIAVEMTDNPNQAHDFVTAENANNIIKKIFNPWERVFTAGSIEVVRSASVNINETILD